jgi:WD40 repeat protein
MSKLGNMVATERYGHVEIWDVADAAVAHKLETVGVTSLKFGPDDALAVAGGETASIWDVKANRVVRSGKGSLVELSPENIWVVMAKGAKGFTVSELESGRELGSFAGGCAQPDKCLPSRDGRKLMRWSSIGTVIYTSGSSSGDSISLPSMGVSIVYAVAPTPDGFFFANSDGIAGIVSGGAPEPRVFATDLSGIRSSAVSNDGKLIALGDNSGTVEVWEMK